MNAIKLLGITGAVLGGIGIAGLLYKRLRRTDELIEKINMTAELFNPPIEDNDFSDKLNPEAERARKEEQSMSLEELSKKPPFNALERDNEVRFIPNPLAPPVNSLVEDDVTKATRVMKQLRHIARNVVMHTRSDQMDVFVECFTLIRDELPNTRYLTPKYLIIGGKGGDTWTLEHQCITSMAVLDAIRYSDPDLNISNYDRLVAIAYYCCQRCAEVTGP